MNSRICFFEPNQTFAERLVDYWLSHGLTRCSIGYYSDKGRFLEDFPRISADLWVLDVCLRGVLSEAPDGRVIWWSDREEDEQAIFKYRSAEVLLHMLQGYVSNGIAPALEDAGPRIISLYSPVKRCLQTTFGITLAHLLSAKGRTLYLNLEGYSGFDRMLSTSFSKDISDFIYFINHSTEDIPFTIPNYMYRLGEVDMIPPVLNPGNLQDISEEMWLHMLQVLRSSRLYDYIIMDVSDYIRGAYHILRESHVVFSLTKSDPVSDAKWQQYQSILEESKESAILQNTRQFEAPHIAVLPGIPEAIAPCPMTDFALQAGREAGLL